MISNRALALAALLAGLAVVALSLAFLALPLRTLMPLHGAYGGQAILAFELADTPQELAAVIGANPPTAEALAIRKTMDQANRLDFAYMACYGAFIALACACAARARRRPWLMLGVLLGPLAAIADVGENLVLLQLTQPGADVPVLLASLHLRTLLKWELLAIASALFASAFIGGGKIRTSFIAGALAILSLSAGALTVLDPATWLALLSGAILLAWSWQLGYAAIVLRVATNTKSLLRTPEK